MKVPTPVYGGTPPEALTVTVVLLPAQRIFPEVKLTASEGAAGWFIVMLFVWIQLLASFTYTVCTPAKTPVKIFEFW